MADMGTVHDLIEAKGKAGTLAFDFDRQVVEAAATYMADEDAGIGFLYSGWCQAALPHRRLANDKGWQIDGERVTLIVEPGMRKGTQGEPESSGRSLWLPRAANPTSIAIRSFENPIAGRGARSQSQ